jgi:alkanesulfonate monooxygenase SsuD/methylene tetrahydromethanopterin reductase-like flavin-dependent oxidoreductase (luciferase family)
VVLPPWITDLDSRECAIMSGSADEVADRIAALADGCAFDRFTYQGDYGGQPWPLVERSLNLFASRVIPQIRSESRVAVAAG